MNYNDIGLYLISVVCSIVLIFLIIRKVRNRHKVRVDILYPNMRYEPKRLKFIDGYKLKYKGELIPVNPYEIFKSMKLKGEHKIILNGVTFKPISFINRKEGEISELFSKMSMKDGKSYVQKQILLGFKGLKDSSKTETLLMLIMGGLNLALMLYLISKLRIL